jgi:arylsulfatase A-like enzyme
MNRIARREFLSTLGRSALGAVIGQSLIKNGWASAGDSSQKKPNFVILFADDMGYGDWNRGGHPTIRTPNMNKMADEGIQLTQFYSGNPVCSPSRSALLTGRNCIRTGVINVLFPNNDMGMSPNEVTIADALKPLGYATACIGKWHLGDKYEYRPLRQGFDYYYGILYSNDMENPDIYRNDEIIEHPTDQKTLTKRYTEEALKFIENNKDQPFFVYLPYTFPHIPLYASEGFQDTSIRGLFGDVVEELDWSVGQINQTLDKLGLSDNTLVIFTSDNGPWITQNQNGGTAGLLRGAKGDTWEGGMREPFIARWPGRIPPGTISTQVASVLDFLPTLVRLAGGKPPDDRPIDGINMMPALEGGKLPERTIFYYSAQRLNAVRKGKWKLHYRYYDNSKGGYLVARNWVTPEKPLLFDVQADPSERFDLADKFPEVVQDLEETASQYKKEIEQKGENSDLIKWFRRNGHLKGTPWG